MSARDDIAEYLAYLETGGKNIDQIIFDEVDVVSVVRCRDCKNFTSDEFGDCCTLLDFEDVKPMGSGFCAWGERRDA